MKKLLFAVLVLTAATYAAADEAFLKANWVSGSVDGQSRLIRDDSNKNKDLAIVGAGSYTGNVTNSSLTADGKNISINDAAVAASAVKGNSDSKGAYVAGGAVLNATASGNTLNLSNMTGASVLQGRAARPFCATRWSASPPGQPSTIRLI